MPLSAVILLSLSQGGIVPTSAASAAAAQSLPAYGHDWSCTNDLDQNGLESDGLTCLAQALYRRIITPRGQLIDDANYGTDITKYLNDDLAQTPTDLARIGSEIDSEMLKDERVVRSQTSVTLLAGGVLSLVTSVTPSIGPSFSLVISASALTTTLLVTGT